jgi:uncharacterized OsmC-like protein
VTATEPVSAIAAMLDGAERLFEKRPDRAAHTVAVRGELVGSTTVAFEIEGHRVTFDEAEYLGGDDRGPNPVAMTLAPLAACEAIIYRYYSERLGIPFDQVEVVVEGDLDLRGGPDIAGVAAGSQAIRLTVELTGPEERSRYETLHDAVARNCPILDTLANGVPVTTALHTGA